jgi:choline dehydrogenase-like flavoprotein
MILEFDDFKKGKLPKVVIIGSGPAGITLSKSLADKGIASLILEIGGENWTEKAHNTSKGEVIGGDYFPLESTHLKYFGGSSNHWAGVSRPLDPGDFDEREDIQGYIGWPIKNHELDPYKSKTEEILEIPSMTERNITQNLMEVQFQLSPPVRFAQKYKKHFEKSDKSHICFYTYLLSVSAEKGRVRAVNLTGPGNKKIVLDIDTVVFCGGGIENSRMLLWSNQQSSTPVVSNTNTLGKYWFEHPHNNAGEMRLLADIYDYRTEWGMGFFSPSPDAMKKYGILNACLRLQRFPNKVNTLIRNAMCSYQPLDSKSTSILSREVDCLHDIQLVWEQQPRPENRIELSKTEKDAFGVPRAELHWDLSELDYKTPKVMMELFGKYLAKEGLGALRSYEHIIRQNEYPKGGVMAGCHHMGGTRMADNANEGVVDSNLQIFGMQNAFVLGSSVFPTCGHANPTYTIVQLALRLADHLKLRV